MTKINKCLYTTVICLIIYSCNSRDNKMQMAKYIGDNRNGLNKKMNIDSVEVDCQLLPEFINHSNQYSDSNRLLNFNLYINASKDKVTDSIYYSYSYHSKDLFKIVINKDTLLPVLGELMANGRRDRMQFTILFEPPKMNDKDSLLFIINKTDLIKKQTQIMFTNKDINNAYKNIY